MLAGVPEPDPDEVALLDAERRAGDLAVERPGLEPDAGRDGDGIVDGDEVELPDRPTVRLVDVLSDGFLAVPAGVERRQELVGVERRVPVLVDGPEVTV